MLKSLLTLYSEKNCGTQKNPMRDFLAYEWRVYELYKLGQNTVESLNDKIGEIGETQKLLNLDFLLQ